MKHYLIEIIWNDPYPKRFDYRVKASNFAVAVSRALKQFRSENKGRRITDGTVKFNYYGAQEKI